MSLSYEHSFFALQDTREGWNGESGLTRFLPPVPSHQNSTVAGLHLTGSHTPRFPKALTDQEAQAGLQGLIAFLPCRENVPRTSVIHSQTHVNPGAFEHPIIILARNGNLAFCAMVTSFGRTSIQQKYAYARDKSAPFWRYVPISHPDHAHVTCNGFGSLHTTKTTPKPSYMNLANGFWIEWQYLEKFNSRQGEELTRLTPDSYLHATWAYHIAQRHRMSFGDDSHKRFNRKITPPAVTMSTLMQARPPTPPVTFPDCVGQMQYWSQHQPQLFIHSRPATPPMNAMAENFVMTSSQVTGGYNPMASEFSMPTVYSPVPRMSTSPWEMQQWYPAAGVALPMY